MKKVITVLLLTIALLGGCTPRGMDVSIDLANIGPQSQYELSASNNAQVTPGTLPSEVNRTHNEEDMLRVSVTTTQIINNRLSKREDAGVDAPVQVGSVQQQYTEINIPEESAVAEQINTVLETELRHDKQETEDVLASAEADYAKHQTDTSTTSDFYEYSYFTNQTTTRLDSFCFSIVTCISAYTGGVHPTYTQSAANFDLSTGKQLSLGDILQPGKGEALNEKLADWLKAKSSDYNLFSMEDCLSVADRKFGTDKLEQQFTDWYLTTNGLTLYFNPFEVSSYSTGVVSVEFTLEEAAELLRPEFLPSAVDDRPCGSFRVYYNTEPPESGITISESIKTDSAGGYLAILGEKTVFDVSVCSISWIGNQSVDRQTLYCTNYLSSEHCLTIYLDSAQELTTLCIRLNPGDGVEQVVYFPADMEPGVYTYSFDKP